MRGAKHEQQLRRAVLQLSLHGDADIGAVLARLDVRQRDRLREMLTELGHVDTGAARGQQDASWKRQLQAFLGRMPAPFAERFEAALNDAGQLPGPDDALAAQPHRMTERTASVVAEAIATHIRTAMPASQRAQRTPLLARWFGKGARS